MTNANESKLSPFNQAIKNFGEVLFGDPRVKDWQRKSLTILLGKLTLEFKNPREKRNLFNIQMALRDIERSVSGFEFLKRIWDESKIIFQLSLLQS